MSRLMVLGRSGKMKMTAEAHADYWYVNFSILVSSVTCPNAGACRFGCYAGAGRMACATALNAYKENLEMVLDGSIWPQLNAELVLQTVKAERDGRQLRVRIHDTGDFFNREYAEKWLETVRMHPKVRFYAYTKMVSLMKSLDIPENLKVTYSYGGLEDYLIEGADPHAIVIGQDDPIPDGYVDGSHDDWYASEGGYRIALRYYGPKSRAFTARPRQ